MPCLPRFWPRPVSARPLTGLLAVMFLALHLPALHPARGQSPDTLRYTLPDIEVEAVRATETEATAPFAVAVDVRDPARLALDPALTLDAALGTLPGTWFNDRGHFALGERLSIRGMGWRSAFGVRGVQVVLDGIPLTMPDGQAILDIVDPALVRRAEVMRGPASLFWGNGSGGALFLSTQTLSPTFTGRIRALTGSDGLWQTTAEAAGPVGPHHVQAYVSTTHQDGFRDYSTGRLTRTGLHGHVALGPSTRLRVTAAAAALDTEHPGSLTREQLEADRTGADTRYVNTASGKESLQAQLGLTLDRQTRAGLASASVYGITRDLQNPLPFAYIDLFRRAGGARLALQGAQGRLTYRLGLDAGLQDDDRLERNNAGGRPGDVRRTDQQETVRNTAAYAVIGLRLHPALRLTAGLRADRVRFDMEDRLTTDGDQSGHRTFAAWSPAFGLAYQRGSALLFANVSTAFETPTTTELVNSPEPGGGFNPDLAPQRTRGVEFGLRGGWPTARLVLDAAVFHMTVADQFNSFTSGDGETFYVNSGRTVHDGVELAVTWTVVPALELSATYAGSRFVFDEGALEGNQLPGIPDHRAFLRLRGERRGFWAMATLEAVSTYFADDANTAENDGYAVLDLNLGHTGVAVGRARLQPFAQVRNLTDTAYNGSVVVNASGGRYYEPAPGRTIQAGLNVRF
ncbi:hypothetical protein AWN76_008125 [Rhodothermaceae bacterium RA]|nr:hypothetical protein AWN76_008125 [Rhodothermaceae bacterium RA]